jgi:hypothetical protein
LIVCAAVVSIPALIGPSEDAPRKTSNGWIHILVKTGLPAVRSSLLRMWKSTAVAKSVGPLVLGAPRHLCRMSWLSLGRPQRVDQSALFFREEQRLRPGLGGSFNFCSHPTLCCYWYPGDSPPLLARASSLRSCRGVLGTWATCIGLVDDGAYTLCRDANKRGHGYFFSAPK